MQIVKVTSHNLYEGAYYLANGAQIVSISQRELRDLKASKVGFRVQYYVIFEVDKIYVENIRTDKAMISVSQMEYFRRKLKKIIRTQLHELQNKTTFQYQPRRQY